MQTSAGGILARWGSAESRVYWLFVAPLLALVLLMYAFPVLQLLWISVSDPTPGWQNYEKIADTPTLHKLLITSLRICVLTTIASLLIGYAITYAMLHTGKGQRSWMMTIVLISFWISVLVRAFSWLTLLRSNGLVNVFLLDLGLITEPLRLARNETGVLIAMTHYMVPYAILPLYAGMLDIDQRLLAAARGLGSGPFSAFWRIYLPLSLPGVVAAGLLVFILCLGFFVTPALLGGGKVLMIAEYISVQVLVTAQWGTATALATLLLASIVALLFTLSRIQDPRKLFGSR